MFVWESHSNLDLFLFRLTHWPPGITGYSVVPVWLFLPFPHSEPGKFIFQNIYLQIFPVSMNLHLPLLSGCGSERVLITALTCYLGTCQGHSFPNSTEILLSNWKKKILWPVQTFTTSFSINRSTHQMPVFLGLLYKWIWFELNNYYLSKLMEALLSPMQKLDTNCKQGISAYWSSDW